MPQLVHAAPPVPHSEPVVGVTHVVPLQQPLGHEVALHTQAPPEQTCPAPHSGPLPHMQTPLDEHVLATEPQATQALPPMPHNETRGGDTHVAPEQHPVGQDAASHTQVPPTHA
jgi:hypothetical protein